VKRLFLLIIVSFILMQAVFSINCVNINVTDTSNKEVSYAWVITVNGDKATCDLFGNIDLCFNYDTTIIMIGALGYETDTLRILKEMKNLRVNLLPKKIMIEEISITHNQTIKNTSMVSTISTNKKEIEMFIPQNITEALQVKSGFTNRSGYQTPLTLRGLSGKRVLVLRNGLKRFGSYPAGYMSHTINIYDLETIDVEKGAASVVYGSGAMAGIINLIDKSIFTGNGFEAKVTTGYGSVNHEKNILLGGGWSNQKLAIKTNVRYRAADNFKYPNGDIAQNSFYKDNDAFIALGYRFSDKQEIQFTTDIHKGGPWGKPAGFNGTNYLKVQTVKENNYNYSLQYKIKRNNVFQTTEISSFYSDESRSLVKNYYTAAGYMLSYVETTRFSNYYYGLLFKNKLKISKNYIINAGGEFYSFHISTPTDAVDYIQGISFLNRVSNNARSYLSGIYVENIYSPIPKVKLVGGVRFDKATVYEGNAYSSFQEEKQVDKEAISGNISALFKTRKSKIKVNTARSFRMPETTELYADSYTSNGILYANPNLKPEYCTSFDIAYNYEFSFIDIELSPFVWYFEKMISRAELKGMPGTNYQFINLDRSRIYGGEINSTIKLKNLVYIDDKLLTSFGIALLNGSNIQQNDRLWADGTPMDYIPPYNLKGSLVFNSSETKMIDFNMSLRLTYYSEQKRLGNVKYATPAYMLFLFSIGFSMNTIKTKPSLNIAINNLLNVEYYSYLSYLPSEGRDFRVFLTFNFD